jgi:hypothetical protein
MIAAEIANMSHGGDRVSEQARNSTLATVTQTEAAKAMKVSPDSVKTVKIKKKATPEIIKAVKGGKMSLNAAKKATKADKPASSAKRKTAGEKWAADQRAQGAPYPEFTIIKAKPIGRMPDDTREKYESKLTSIKSDLVEIELMTDYADQMSEPLRHLLTDELKGIEEHAETIAKKMYGQDNLRGLNRPLCDIDIPLFKDEDAPKDVGNP